MSERERRRISRARALWTILGAVFTIAAAIAFGLGRSGLGVALLVGLTICLGGLTRAGRPKPVRRD